MAESPELTAHEQIIREIEQLRDKALTGELTGIMVVLVMADGTRKEVVAGSFADECAAVIESSRETLNEILAGKVPGGDQPKH